MHSRSILRGHSLAWHLTAFYSGLSHNIQHVRVSMRRLLRGNVPICLLDFFLRPVDIKSPCVAGFKALGEVQIWDAHGFISERKFPQRWKLWSFKSRVWCAGILHPLKPGFCSTVCSHFPRSIELTTDGIWKTVDRWVWGKGEPAMAMATDWLMVLPSPSSTITEASRPLWMWFSVKQNWLVFEW